MLTAPPTLFDLDQDDPERSETTSPTPAPRRKVGDLIELQIGCKQMRRYRITSVTDDLRFEATPC